MIVYYFMLMFNVEWNALLDFHFQGDLPGMIDDAIALDFLPQDVDRKTLHEALKVVIICMLIIHLLD